jgi:regulator of Ty1 transposition protein 103
MIPGSFISGGEQSAPLRYAPQGVYYQNSGHSEEDPRKSAAAAVAAKLTASTSSIQMLSCVLSSFAASEGVIGNPMTESSAEFHSGKRTKLENGQPSYVPSQNPQQPPPPFSFSETTQHSASTSNEQYTPNDQPPPPPSSSPPPLPPLPPTPQQYPVQPFMQTVGSVNNMAYNYGVMQQQPSMATYPAAGVAMNNVSPFTPPMNAYQGFQGSDGNYYNQSSVPVVPISRQ